MPSKDVGKYDFAPQMHRLREVTGGMASDSRDVGFLYALMRDCLPVGTVWRCVLQVIADNPAADAASRHKCLRDELGKLDVDVNALYAQQPQGRMLFTDGNLMMIAATMHQWLQNPELSQPSCQVADTSHDTTPIANRRQDVHEDSANDSDSAELAAIKHYGRLIREAVTGFIQEVSESPCVYCHQEKIVYLDGYVYIWQFTLKQPTAGEVLGPVLAQAYRTKNYPWHVYVSREGGEDVYRSEHSIGVAIAPAVDGPFAGLPNRVSINGELTPMPTEDESGE